MYNTEQFISMIAKAIELIPRDVTGKEISDILNDALAHMVIDTDNTTFFTALCMSSYLEFMEDIPSKVTELSDEYPDITVEEVQKISELFYSHITNKINDILYENIQRILTEAFSIPTEDTENDVDNT